MALRNRKADPIEIENSIRGPMNCPSCGTHGDNLIVSTEGGSPKTRNNPSGGNVKFIGYDCRNCGQRLRFI